MDREIVEQKLESLRRCFYRIATECTSETFTLVSNLDLQAQP